MKAIARLIAGVLAALAVMLPAAAHGVADDATRNPKVVWPIPRPAETSGPIEIQMQGQHGHAWGIRRFAKEADGEIRGIRIHEAGRCSDRPRALCVKVHRANYGDTGWYAETALTGPERRDVYLNTHYDNGHRYACTAHEFGHVLGLDHHRRLGVDGRRPNVVHLSRPELRVLRKAYPATRAN